MDDIQKKEPTEKLAPIEMARELYKLQTLRNSIDEKLQTLKSGLLETMMDLGVLSLKTEGYVISRKVYNRPTVFDDNLAKESLEKLLPNEEVKMKTVVDMEVMKFHVKHLLEKGIKIDGINSTRSEYVAVRLNEKKEDKETK
jgi:hypothetical protein